MKTFAFWAAASLCALTPFASAQVSLGDYNLIVFNDLDIHASIEGNVLVGGDFNNGVIATRVGALANGPDTVLVGGNVNGSFTIERGNFIVQGNVNLNAGGNINLNQQGTVLRYGGTANPQSIQNLVNQGRAIQDASIDVTSIVAQAQTDFIAQSTFLSTIAANSSTVLQGSNQLRFEANNTDALAVFDVNAADLFDANPNIASIDLITTAATDTILINVTGDVNGISGTNFIGGFNTNNAANILWNFSDATNLDLRTTQWFGSILAPFAHLQTQTSIDGSVIVDSAETFGQIHLPNFDGNLPVIPEPSLLILAMVTASGLFMIMRRRRR